MILLGQRINEVPARPSSEKELGRVGPKKEMAWQRSLDTATSGRESETEQDESTGTAGGDPAQ
jgi:hypothetical protein